MSFFLTDIQIQTLITEEKRISEPLSQFSGKFREKKGHKESSTEIDRGDNGAFRIIIRQSIENPLDFSVILGFIPPNKTDPFLIRRYNGKSHEHRNKIERESAFYDFHIHTATERYQKEGLRADYYAEVTDRYSDIYGAIDCLVCDCNIISSHPQTELFS